jgi:hypothetical protein
VITSAADGSVRLINLDTNALDLLFETETRAYCFKHVVDPNSPRTGLVTLSDGPVIRYDTRSPSSAEEIIRMQNHPMVYQLSSGRFTAPPSATALAFNPRDPNLLALGTSTQAVVMYDVRSLRDSLNTIIPTFTPIPESYPGEAESVSDLVWDQHNRLIVNYCRQNLIEIDYNHVRDGCCIGRFNVGDSLAIPRQWSGRINHQTFLKEVALLGDEYILTGGDCGNLFVYERFGSQRLLL